MKIQHENTSTYVNNSNKSYLFFIRNENRKVHKYFHKSDLSKNNKLYLPNRGPYTQTMQPTIPIDCD